MFQPSKAQMAKYREMEQKMEAKYREMENKLDNLVKVKNQVIVVNASKVCLFDLF